jgi:signal transduction histidine kinase
LREEFIAVLGHDLRNPLSSIQAGAQVLQRVPLDERGSKMLDIIQKSVGRMAGLIEDVMDFARARLGAGLPLRRSADQLLRPTLEQVIAELRTASPARKIEAHLDFVDPVNCDRARVAQLLSNLLGNALTHGSPDAPVSVSASSDNGTFELSVANAGAPIAEATIERLFQPFTRATSGPDQKGLGLGLYIASQIARAHGGTLHVTSTPERTCFTFRMPITAR